MSGLLLALALMAQTPDVYLLTGQSNMSGRGLVEELTAEERVADPAITLYGNEGTIRPAVEPLDTAVGQVDAISTDTIAAVGPGLFFARTLHGLNGRPILLVPAPRAARRWRSGSQTRGNRARAGTRSTARAWPAPAPWARCGASSGTRAKPTPAGRTPPPTGARASRSWSRGSGPTWAASACRWSWCNWPTRRRPRFPRPRPIPPGRRSRRCRPARCRRAWPWSPPAACR
ncbi:MAG: hypothetical protein J7528_02305 [Caulobacter sp.]|nr:hypothetical protein [Caulobacter sp.]